MNKINAISTRPRHGIVTGSRTTFPVNSKVFYNKSHCDNTEENINYIVLYSYQCITQQHHLTLVAILSSTTGMEFDSSNDEFKMSIRQMAGC